MGPRKAVEFVIGYGKRSIDCSVIDNRFITYCLKLFLLF